MALRWVISFNLLWNESLFEYELEEAVGLAFIASDVPVFEEAWVVGGNCL